MKYRGFREETLLPSFHKLKALGLSSNEAYAILNLDGAKWRSVQIRESRGNEYQEEEDGRVFHEATVALMNSTMTETQQLAMLGHATEGERFMLVAISIALNKLFSRSPSSIRKWLRAGDKETRKIILSFAIGSSIIVEPQAIDILMHRIVKLRYGVVFDSGSDISDSVIEVIETLGTSGYSCLKPIADTLN
ncbi:MAG: hypothetical protein ABSF43_03130 [Rectinemataceae bacterium]|jgi:hypothetical protein